MKKALYIILFLLAVLAWRDWRNREITHAPGILVAEQPRQAEINEPRFIRVEDYRLTLRAEFELRARVLSIENYRWGSEADLSPVDFALGWGVMSDQAVLDRISVTQGTRWYFTRYEFPPPVTDRQIITSSSNMHMIPANPWVAEKAG